MTTLHRHLDLPADPDAVWSVAGEFGALDQWHPWVPSCSLSEDGQTRTIGSGAMRAVETLEAEQHRSHSYRVDQSPMPLSDYRCTWTAAPHEGGTRLSIHARFEPAGVPEAQALAMLGGFFDAAFEALSARFSGAR